MVSYAIKSLSMQGDTFYCAPHDPVVVGKLFDPNMLNIQSIWDCLRNANNESLNAAYGDRHGDMTDKPVPFICVEHLPDPLQMIRIVQNFEYQACEHKGWYASKAAAICSSIIDLAIEKMIKTDKRGRDGIGWGFDEEITPDPYFRAPKLSELKCKPVAGQAYRIC